MSVERQVRRKIRSMGLGTQDWVKVNVKNPDPPAYNVDSVYQRKTRLNLGKSETGETQVTMRMVMDSIFTARGAYLPFRQAKVSLITVYAEAAANAFIDVRPATEFTVQNSLGRSWADVGTQGSKRACVRLSLPTHCQRWVNIEEGTVVVTVNHPNTVIIVDVTLALSNSTVFPQTRVVVLDSGQQAQRGCFSSRV